MYNKSVEQGGPNHGKLCEKSLVEFTYLLYIYWFGVSVLTMILESVDVVT